MHLYVFFCIFKWEKKRIEYRPTHNLPMPHSSKATMTHFRVSPVEEPVEAWKQSFFPGYWNYCYYLIRSKKGDYQGFIFFYGTNVYYYVTNSYPLFLFSVRIPLKNSR